MSRVIFIVNILRDTSSESKILRVDSFDPGVDSHHRIIVTIWIQFGNIWNEGAVL